MKKVKETKPEAIMVITKGEPTVADLIVLIEAKGNTRLTEIAKYVYSFYIGTWWTHLSGDERLTALLSRAHMLRLLGHMATGKDIFDPVSRPSGIVDALEGMPSSDQPVEFDTKFLHEPPPEPTEPIDDTEHEEKPASKSRKKKQSLREPFDDLFNPGEHMQSPTYTESETVFG